MRSWRCASVCVGSPANCRKDYGAFGQARIKTTRAAGAGASRSRDCPPSRSTARRRPGERLARRRPGPHRLRARAGRDCKAQARGRPGHAGRTISAPLGLLSPGPLARAGRGRCVEAAAARPGLVRGSGEPALQPAGPPAGRRLHRPDVAQGPSLRPGLRARPEFLAPRQGRRAARSSSILRGPA